MAYEPTWPSLDARPCPAWFGDAKFGIFVHWGLYSVPAWAPKGKYAEWYWASMRDKKSPTWRFHRKTYGKAFRYQDFVPQFTCELFDPMEWARLFEAAGARYVVLTAKHHDGFCLWPSAEAWNWNSLDLTPHRDLVGELTAAVRKRSMRMALYYSLYEWFNPIYHSNVARYVAERMLPQLRDLVRSYAPSLIFADGEWDHPSDVWRSAEFLAWLFNGAPNRDEVVVNDRWGSECRSAHGGYFTTEYGHVGEGKELATGRKWEENRAIGASFGYNRNEGPTDYLSAEKILDLLTDTVSRGGNLCLDVGPTADGRIPVVMQKRLVDVGRWLRSNGEAIYDTRPWRLVSDPRANVRYTATDDAVYAIAAAWPTGDELVLEAPVPGEQAAVALLGTAHKPACRHADGTMRIAVGDIHPQALADRRVRAPYVFKLTDVS